MRNAGRAGFLVAIAFIALGCPQGSPPEAPNAAHEEHASEVAFQLPERDLIPEGMCYDPVGDVFYLGSVRKSKILEITRAGDVRDFATSTDNEIRGFLGMRVDAERRVLWANWHQGKTSTGFDPEVRNMTGISKYDLTTGVLIREYAVEKTGDNHLFNDVAIAADGTVYITSFAYGAIYRIDSETNQLEEFLRMPEGVWNNGIDITPDGRFLFVVGNEKIFRVDLDSDEMLKLPVPEGEIIGYGDGLYLYDDDLVAITGHREGDRVVNRVIRIGLSDEMNRITGIRVLDRDHPLYAIPTTGALAGEELYYIATAQFDKIDESGNLATWEELSDTIVLRLKLD